MIGYKKKALEKFDLPSIFQVFFCKARKKYICNKCREEISVGEVYWESKTISSYLVDPGYKYHLDCVQRDDILNEKKYQSWDYIEEKMVKEGDKEQCPKCGVLMFAYPVVIEGVGNGFKCTNCGFEDIPDNFGDKKLVMK